MPIGLIDERIHPVLVRAVLEKNNISRITY